jgi:lysophospholipase L1-like esterase
MLLRLLLPLALLIAGAGPALGDPAAPPAAGSKYVAMGSSFASGPGIGTADASAPMRCGRSSENYAHLLATSRHLSLVDVTCGGATTQHILGSWNELPAQISAVDSETRLVTITIGGNDLNYIGLLAGYSCRRLPPDSAK